MKDKFNREADKYFIALFAPLIVMFTIFCIFDTPTIISFINEYWGGIIAIGSLIIATFSLFIAYWEVISSRNHNELSVRPYLTLNYSRDKKQKSGSIKLEIVNNGLGPAIIQDFKLYHNKKFILKGSHQQYVSYIKKIIPQQLSCNFGLGTASKNQVLSMGEVLRAISFEFNVSKNDDAMFTEILESLDLVIEYKDIYDNSFCLDSRKEIKFSS